MSKFATGKNALAISDRSGLQFPYREMVKEWTGALVHYTEFEAKQPQLQPIRIAPDPQKDWSGNFVHMTGLPDDSGDFHKLMQLYNRIDEKQTSHTDSTDKQWVWTLVERVQNNEHLTKAVLLKANNLWRTYA